MDPPQIPRLLHIFFRVLLRILEAIGSTVYPWIYENQPRIPPIPEDERDILTSPAVDLAYKIRTGSLTSRNVVQAFVNRALTVHPYINAFVDNRFEDALSEADAVDELIQRTPQKERLKLFESLPFLGVPFSAKDSMSTKGLRQTVGLVCRRNKVATKDSSCVRNLRKAGAIILGVTNVPEICMWMETYNKVYGRTNNPYHLGRTPGGSSGGEGAAIASASSPFGIGSDIGGSIRMPAFFCGIYGHKCSTGEPISNQGQDPPSVGITNDFLSTGPMTRHAKDLLPAFKALISNPEISVHRLRLSEPVNVKELKVYYMEGIPDFPLMSNVHHELQTCQMDLLKDLQERTGAHVEKLKMEEFYWSFNIWNQKMKSEPKCPSYATSLSDGAEPPMRPLVELLKWFLFKSTDYTLISILLALVNNLGGPDDKDQDKFLALCDTLRKKLEDKLGHDGVLLFPSHPLPAPYHGEPLLKPFNFAYTAIFNVLGNPVTQVPLGISPTTRTPLGIQVVAALNQDRLSIALAEEIERLRGGQTWRSTY